MNPDANHQPKMYNSYYWTNIQQSQYSIPLEIFLKIENRKLTGRNGE